MSGEGPWVVNRHAFRSRGGRTSSKPDARPELPQPWIYIGRGTPLGNPYTLQEHGQNALGLFRRHLWKLLLAEDPPVIAVFRRITTETSLVCSCAPAPCHGDICVRAWRWWVAK